MDHFQSQVVGGHCNEHICYFIDDGGCDDDDDDDDDSADYISLI
jgi:hypothetical protein